MTKKVLITGSNGMLGKDILDVFKKKNAFDIYVINRNIDTNLIGEKSKLIDLTNLKALDKILKEINPHIIIHCAAMVDVDYCEKNQEDAYRINVESTKLLASFDNKKTKFIYISTDSVFDGINGNYTETSPKAPLNYYAITKNLSENIIQKINKNSIIIRTNIYGYHRNKGKSIVEWALGELFEGKEIFGFDDVYFNPVYTKQLARIVLQLIDRNFYGIIHIGSKDIISKYEFLKLMSSKFKINGEKIKKISIKEASFDAKRPVNTSLNVDKMKEYLNFEINLEDGINELIKDYKGR